MSKGRVYSKTYADTLMRERMVREVGAFADHFLNEELTTPTLVCQDFGIDFKTTKALRLAKTSVSFETLRKFCYVFAFYIDKKTKEAEQDKNLVRRKVRLEEYDKITEAFKAIYGFEATFVLELCDKHKDLREIFKR